MKELNSYSAEECITDFTKLAPLKQILQSVLGMTPEQCVQNNMTYKAAALMIWTEKVRQNGEWDHKPKIGKRFHPRTKTTQEYHAYGDRRYFYDIWSNIHYGYIGMASGFSESALLDGAGLEQIGSTLLTGHMPSREGRTTGKLRDWDGQNDRVSIQVGIDLHKKYLSKIDKNFLLDKLLASAIKFKLPD
jgi:Bacterial toxin 44